MTRSAWVAAVVLLLAAACASDAGPRDPPASVPQRLLLPDSAVPRMSGDTTPVDVDRLANEVTHPD
jgi:hypothetical protein